MATAAVPLVATAFNVGSKVVQGRAQKKAADSEARQMEANARRVRERGQAESEEIQRQTARTMSDAQAIQASSGFSGSDPSSIRQIAKIAGVGKHNELAALYEAEQEASGIERGAAATKRAGRSARNAAFMGAASTAFSGYQENDGFGLFKRRTEAPVTSSQPSFTRRARAYPARPGGSSITRVSF